jgi:hypothetical protein
MMVRRRGSSKKSGPWDRQGSLLAEVAMSGAMLMIAMALTLKVLGWVGVERKVWDRRQWAAQEAANVMEKITSRPFREVKAETAQKLSLSPEVRRLLPDAELKVEVGENDQAGGAGSKRVALQLRWHNRSGEWDAPVRLVSWIYGGRAGR